MTGGNQLNAKFKEQITAKGIDIKPEYSVKKTRINESVEEEEEDEETGSNDGETLTRKYNVTDLSFPGTTDSYKSYRQTVLLEQVGDSTASEQVRTKLQFGLTQMGLLTFFLFLSPAPSAQSKEALCKVHDMPSVEPVLQPTEKYELPDG